MAAARALAEELLQQIHPEQEFDYIREFKEAALESYIQDVIDEAVALAWQEQTDINK